MPDKKLNRRAAGEIAKGSPAVGIPLAVAKLGDEVERRIPDSVRRAARTVKRYASRVASRVKSKARIARHQAMRRRSR